MKVLLVVLQNAWGVADGYVPDYSVESFSASHTGKRLRNAIPVGVEVHIRNASPLVGKNADSNFPPQPLYLKHEIEQIEPDIILACGKNAREAIMELELDCYVVKMPHPAFRQLSDNMLRRVRRKIEKLL